MIGAIIGKKMVRSQYDRLNRGDIETFMAGKLRRIGTGKISSLVV
ncbi:hypothetical protein ES703_110100 [subsurface metagenome]